MANATKTVKSSGGDYTSLNAALAGMSGNLTTDCGGTGGAGILTIECYAMGDTNLADTGTGYTTSADYYINITVPVAERHSGVWSDSKYRLVPNVDEAQSLTIQESYTIIDGLQIAVTSHASRTSYLVGCRVSSGNHVVIKNCICKGKASITNSLGLAVQAGDVQLIYNNIIYDLVGSGCKGIAVDNEDGDQLAYIYNNTVYGCASGIVTDRWRKHTLTNNLVANCTTDFSGEFLSATTNATDGSTAPTAGTTSGNRTSQTFTFVDADNDDFHLASNDAGARDYGTSLSGTFTTDIDGETRSGTWDIGADEYVAAGGLPNFMYHYMHH
jgi:hypothetical protein